MYTKVRFFFFCSCLLCTFNISAQFNTIRKEKKITKIESSKNIEAIDNTVKKEMVNPEPTIITADTLIKKKGRILFSLPLAQLRINSAYGYRNDPFTKKKKFHAGIDFATNSEDVYAMMPGRIKEVGFKKNGLGNYVVIDHGEFQITYGHLHTSIGTKGDYVNAGDIIGLSGNTGRSTGEHLHLTVKYQGKIINPEPVITYIDKYLKQIRPDLIVEHKKRE